MANNWREGTVSWRQVLLILGVYLSVLLVVGSVLFLFLPEQRRVLWWIGPAMGLAVLGFLWGRAGDKWSMVLLIAVRPVDDAYTSVKPLLMSLLAAVAMFATLWVGFGIGCLSKRLGRSQG